MKLGIMLFVILIGLLFFQPKPRRTYVVKIIYGCFIYDDTTAGYWTTKVDSVTKVTKRERKGDTLYLTIDESL